MINRNYKLALILILALALRLLVWRWRDQYPLGGDEQEYLAQALTFLQERRYTELRFMRPPLYTGFLIATIYLFDSLIQNIRLAQAVLSTLTILPIYAVARILFPQRVALIAALLAALSYTLAATATELLSETLFLFGLACSLWLLTLASSPQHQWRIDTRNLPSATPTATRANPAQTPIWGALLAGAAVGALALIRSVALPLILLGAAWLLNETMRAGSPGQPANPASRHPRMRGIVQITRSSQLALAFLFAAMLTIAPWTARNYTTYGGLILIDTTGAENLWLDNDPTGREEVKRQLYAIGDDRLARQRLATQQGIAVIRSDFPRFLGKAASEATRFFALQYYDDLRDRPAIWVAPPDVWARLLLGDGLWLLVLFAGVTGFWRAPPGRPDLRWIAIPWALYTVLTACIFHVELRYRLPLWPVLVPYAAWIIDHLVRSRSLRSWNARAVAESRLQPGVLRSIGFLSSLGLLITLTLLHRPYLTDSALLAAKHLALARANAALEQGQDPGWDRELQTSDALWAAGEALRLDPRSALARIALARSAIRAGDVPTALRQLRDAEDSIRAHPQPHLLRGAILLSQGDPAEARREFRYETDSLEDLQAWAWHVFPDILPAPTRITIGDGLDLGHIQGFYAAESAGTRWTTSRASVRLLVPSQRATLSLRVNGSRPSGADSAQLTIRSTQSSQINVHYVLTAGWQTITIPIRPDSTGNIITIMLEASTFRPRSLDRTSPDNRDLGIQVDWVEVNP